MIGILGLVTIKNAILCGNLNKWNAKYCGMCGYKLKN